MPEAWRIVRENLLASAFTGQGAAKFGGRWNSRGVAIVYTSATRSLAALEMLVHLNLPEFFRYRIIRLEFSEALVDRMAVVKLPRNWREEPPPPTCQRIGDLWVKQARSAVLALPSVIIPEEINYMLNPAHRDFKKINIGKPADFRFDARLL
jgi:RES domain-containing protein